MMQDSDPDVDAEMILDAIEAPQKGHGGTAYQYGQARGKEAPTTNTLEASRDEKPFPNVDDSDDGDGDMDMDAKPEAQAAAGATTGGEDCTSEFDEDAGIETLTGEGADMAERPSSDESVATGGAETLAPMPSSPVASGRASLAMSKSKLTDPPVTGNPAE